MTNNNFDEFENEGEQEEVVGAVAKTGVAANLANAWRARPLFKLLVLMTAVGAVVAASVSLFSSHQSTETSRVVNPPDLNVAPGGPVSPYMKQQTDLANEQRSKSALEAGGSALPTPVGQSTDVGDLTENKVKNDALNELRAEVEVLQKQQVQQQQQMQQKIQQAQQVQPRQQETFDDSLAQSMQRQMAQLMESWAPKGVKQVTVTKSDEENPTGAAKSASAAGGSAASEQASASPQVAPKVMVAAGTVSYAQLLTEANSDVPSPILAQIVSGPLAGARAIGQFQVANGYNDYLVLQFNVADRKGVEYKINAIALDPNTTLGGMATEVDQRYFTRVVLPAAAGFLQGLGSALGQNSSTTTTSGSFAIVQQGQAGLQQGVFQGLAQGAQTASQFFQNQANLTKPLVRVAAGTPMGLFFVTTVYDPSTIPQVNYPNGYLGPNNMPYANNGFNGGYNNGYNGYNNGAQGQGAAYGSGNMASNMPYGNSGYGSTSGYGASGQSAGTGYSVPYPNYATPSSLGTGSTVNYVSGSGLNNNMSYTGH